jgi:hypothetical protein
MLVSVYKIPWLTCDMQNKEEGVICIPKLLDTIITKLQSQTPIDEKRAELILCVGEIMQDVALDHRNINVSRFAFSEKGCTLTRFYPDDFTYQRQMTVDFTTPLFECNCTIDHGPSSTEFKFLLIDD